MDACAQPFNHLQPSHYSGHCQGHLGQQNMLLHSLGCDYEGEEEEEEVPVV